MAPTSVFKSMGSVFRETFKRDETRWLVVYGFGGAFAGMLALTATLPTEDFMKNESPYARKYFSEYHEYNKEKVAREGSH